MTAEPVVYVYKMRRRLRGDLNNNFVVDATDVDLMRQILDGSIAGPFSNEIEEAIDVSNDGVIDILDLLALQAIVSGNTNDEVVFTLLTSTGGPFEGQTDPAVIGFNANPDSDELSNVFELWLGADPAESDGGYFPKATTIDVDGADRGAVIVEVSAAADDLLKVVAEFSFDHINWRTSENRVILSETPGRRTIRFTDVVDLPAGSGLFARFSVDPVVSP